MCLACGLIAPIPAIPSLMPDDEVAGHRGNIDGVPRRDDLPCPTDIEPEESLRDVLYKLDDGLVGHARPRVRARHDLKPPAPRYVVLQVHASVDDRVFGRIISILVNCIGMEEPGPHALGNVIPPPERQSPLN